MLRETNVIRRTMRRSSFGRTARSPLDGDRVSDMPPLVDVAVAVVVAVVVVVAAATAGSGSVPCAS